MHSYLKPLFIACVSVFSMAGPLPAYSQGALDFSTINIDIVALEDNVHVLMGGAAQGNILVLSGDDGLFIVDTMYAPMHDKIMAALRMISPQSVKFVINTHLHGDHTAGNAAMTAQGAVVIAQSNTRKRMVELASSMPADTFPALTYDDRLTLYLNDEIIDIFWPTPAHTAGDSIIYLRNANIMHVGDVPASVRYPNIGVTDGGTVAGMIAAGELVMQVANQDTRIIPGHLGPVIGFAEIEEQLEMFRTVSSRIQSMIDSGMSLEAVLAAKPTAEFDAARAAGAITAERFVTLVYTDLNR